MPDLLPGEDRTFGSGLFVDLIPTSCWFTNVRSCVSRQNWDRLRHMVYSRAGQRCEICTAAADPGAGFRLEAHERWSYDETSSVQRLVRLVCVCRHATARHISGSPESKGRGESALAHLMCVNGWNIAAAEAHIGLAAQLWRQRSLRDWHLDLSMLTEAGIALRPPPAAADRAARAKQHTTRTR